MKQTKVENLVNNFGINGLVTAAYIMGAGQLKKIREVNPTAAFPFLVLMGDEWRRSQLINEIDYIHLCFEQSSKAGIFRALQSNDLTVVVSNARTRNLEILKPLYNGTAVRVFGSIHTPKMERTTNTAIILYQDLAVFESYEFAITARSVEINLNKHKNTVINDFKITGGFNADIAINDYGFRHAEKLKKRRIKNSRVLLNYSVLCGLVDELCRASNVSEKHRIVAINHLMNMAKDTDDSLSRLQR